MFERLRRVLVESFVGAIALGYLLAECILYFMNIFGSPVSAWVSRNLYQDLMPTAHASGGSSFQLALPELVRFLVLAVVWYGLLRWLYFKPLNIETTEPAPNPEQVS
jgi:hypothetical protein